ncbi:hypothetical protein [Anaerosporobacter sp.]|uniref:hypothetical protein n=1 Tax=Anaerosporobacter sp. TaxID=1872529 RepID=UPI00286FA062|nr:hypothetical protein [Anaerosporobacter sp.]
MRDTDKLMEDIPKKVEVYSNENLEEEFGGRIADYDKSLLELNSTDGIITL